jgi:galactoside O-acetyltransferase
MVLLQGGLYGLLEGILSHWRGSRKGGVNMSCYSYDEMTALGIGSIGTNVRIHRTVQLLSTQQIHIGNNVRIDCFSLLSAGDEGIHIGNYVHIAVGCYLFGGGGCIRFEDFSGLSSRVTIYTASDDYSEGNLTNPTVPDRYRKLTKGPVTLRRHALIGCGSVIMPNVELGVAASVGTLSFVPKNVEPFMVVHGNPARVFGKRDPRVLDLEQTFLASIAD